MEYTGKLYGEGGIPLILTASDVDALESMRSRLCAALGLPTDSAPETVAEAVEARRVVVPEPTEESLVRAGGPYCINDREPFQRGARWAVEFVRENARAIPADRVLGEGEIKMEICERDCREDDEDALEVLRVCGYGQQAEMLEVAIKAHDLRANQGGSAT